MLQNEKQDDTEAGTIEDVIEIEDDGFNVGDFV